MPRVMRWPSRPTKSGALSGQAASPRFAVDADDAWGKQLARLARYSSITVTGASLDGDAAVLLTFSANATFALLSGSDVTDIGVAQLSCANAREQSCKK